MSNFEENFSDGLEAGQLIDTEINLLFPWYTRSFLKELNSWDIKDWKVFEYGSGNSTHWWRKKAKEVHSVDSNLKWAKNTNSIFIENRTDFINYPLSLVKDNKFDCIIIDGDPVEWRDDCTEIALACIKDGGVIIFDNYMQESANLKYLPKTNDLLKNKKRFVFNQLGHSDWATAYWII
jgi:hypothetical protein